MKVPRVTGLVSAGGLNQSFLTRMPVVLSALGPVKAASLRVARRIVNSLRAGCAVTAYSALKPCHLIWIAVPGGTLDSVVRDLAAETPLEGTMVVLCGSARDSRWPGPLSRTHARVATLNAVEESRERLFVAEGHPDVIRELHRLAAAEKRKLIEIHPDSKPLYLAGVDLAARLVLPWFAAALDSLRAAGLQRSDAVRVVEALGARSLRAYGKAGRKAGSPAAVLEMRRLRRDLESIQSVEPRLAKVYAEGVECVLEYFGQRKWVAGRG